MSTLASMVPSYLTMDMLPSMILALMMRVLFCVTLTILHNPLVILGETGLHQIRLDLRVPGLTRSRGPMVLRLKRTSGSPMVGIYKCTIEQSKSDVLKNVYVGLYNNTNKGRIKQCSSSHVSNCFP